ncbi:adenine DNA glycosylase isoform X5 [Amborella trichopoda]|uniref:adenine DNA glycosylase isoform X5 n=1 Tax=Amborella trichopoda TaxID=13333 RepID=UPI0009C0B424|nr:adenine DNA glycosylase isoform X5 [Amborella trichopoda]|eukprot:XP_020531898.1 adenine DNA glycosylase isoform X5 [Amborella trichopoda]
MLYWAGNNLNFPPQIPFKHYQVTIASSALMDDVRRKTCKREKVAVAGSKREKETLAEDIYPKETHKRKTFRRERKALADTIEETHERKTFKREKEALEAIEDFSLKDTQRIKPTHMREKGSLRDIEDFSLEETLKIRASLLGWYDKNQRILPWRANSVRESEEREDAEARAYAVWVSEVMLQQTRVATVIRYYGRWMEKWPSIHHLAQASQEAVPVVDGNVIRVIARLKAISSNPKESTTVKGFWKLAGQLVDPERPGDFNQALMELGSTLCTPSSPSCSSCPVSKRCQALSLSKTPNSGKEILVTDFPVKVSKVKQREDFAAVCLVEITEKLDLESWKLESEKDIFLMIKRPDEGLLAGLWEFPSVLLDETNMGLCTRRSAMNKYLKGTFGLETNRSSRVIFRGDVGEYVHIFTHIRLKMHVELLVLNLKGGIDTSNVKNDSQGICWRCVDENSIKNIGLTSGVRKVYNMIQDFKKKGLLQNPVRGPKKKDV